MLKTEFKPRRRKCKNPDCRAEYMTQRPMQTACSPTCALAMARVKARKAHEAKKKRERAEIRERKEKLKTKGDHLREAQAAFNLFIRERDRAAGHPCISSGRLLDWSGNQVDAGHWRSTGAAPHLRFDERNCHAQSKHDNRYLSGNAAEYRVGLIQRIGLEAVEALEADQTTRHYTIDDLIEIKRKYRAKARELAKKRQGITS